MFVKKTTVKRRNLFSLIELLIVIGIMGALAALILPHFSSAESASKDTICDYNNAGTLRYVNMFRSANGVYPSGFHIGANTAAADVVDEENDTAVGKMALPTRKNIVNHTTTQAISATDNSYGMSLMAAGIAQLAYGTHAAADVGTVTAVRVINGDWSDTLGVDGTWKDATEAGGGTALTLKGVKLSDWVAAGNATEAITDENQKLCRKSGESQFKIVPLFAASTVDWENAYPFESASQASKVSIALEGKCPWVEAGMFRFYICFFKVYADGTAAKLIATACPECGILDSDSF